MNNFNFFDTDESSGCIIVHLISGEFYTGKCIKTSKPNIITIDTTESKIEIPLWTIKRVKFV
ncbi:hypothetical protein P364_0131770 [Paenibacillus sp. MAEPY2]|nr:hypothetical protein P363_0133040 [Paenibacillus sp. MAEPY1]KGP77769.1 hypothetical protein P364_0131770 [Paenibacillus sp. MAEPY2]